MYSLLHSQLTPLYKKYNEVIKPLIAAIEVRIEAFPTPIYNEIRAYNDHVARCYSRIDDEAFVASQIRKAQGHIERIILDCYKFLNVTLYDKVVRNFDKRTKRIDLTVIHDGEFYIEYKKMRQYIVENLKQAKLLECQDNKEESIALYQGVYNKYTEMEELIVKNETHIIWAKAKFYSGKVLRFLGWLVSAIISGIISSSIIPWDKLIGLVS